MDYQELHQKTDQELQDLLLEHQHELRELHFKASEGQLKKVRSLRQLKRLIAQVLTALNTRRRAA